MAENKLFAFLFWKTFKIFLKNNCQKICTFQKNVVPLHSISPLCEKTGLRPDRIQTATLTEYRLIYSAIKKITLYIYGNIHY